MNFPEKSSSGCHRTSRSVGPFKIIINDFENCELVFMLYKHCNSLHACIQIRIKPVQILIFHTTVLQRAIGHACEFL
mgnify:CR=1 FL=1